MSAASWLRWSVALLMAAIAGYHVVRLLVAHRRGSHAEADVDLMHASMGSAMTLMLTGSLTVANRNFWALAISASALWFVLRVLLAYVRAGARSIGHPLRQAVLSGAMVFMVLAASTPARTGTRAALMSPMLGGSMDQGPALLLICAVVVVAGWTAAALRHPARGRLRPAATALAPRMTAGCQVAMSVGTVYMLLLMA